MQKRAARVGFDWPQTEQVLDKLQEECAELVEAHTDGTDHAHVKEEFGDLLFSLVNYARFINIDPEEALERTNKKFIKRFQYLETESKKDGKTISDMSLDEMDEYWEAAKKL